MAGMMDQLAEILTEETQNYEDLLGLSLEKRDVIIQNDIDQLQKINHLENIIISKNLKLEKKRIELVSDMAVVLCHKQTDLTLEDIITLMDGKEEQKLLIDVRDKIKKVVLDLKEINIQNGQLIQNALEYIEFSNNLLRSNNAPLYPGHDDPLDTQGNYLDTTN
ncbi:MAG: flagellar protein FlgN [Turicibacter sp.]|nr:flagellar protein FlgN [Turicibacter sp.]